MAVSSTDRLAGPFIGNDTVTVFPFAFKVFEPKDLYVLLESSGGNTVLLVIGTDYYAALNGDQATTPGGSVTPVCAELLDQRRSDGLAVLERTSRLDLIKLRLIDRIVP